VEVILVSVEDRCDSNEQQAYLETTCLGLQGDTAADVSLCTITFLSLHRYENQET